MLSRQLIVDWGIIFEMSRLRIEGLSCVVLSRCGFSQRLSCSVVLSRCGLRDYFCDVTFED